MNEIFKYLGKNPFYLIATFLLINGAMKFEDINLVNKSSGKINGR